MLRRYLRAFDTRDLPVEDVDVLIVGSGIAGLYAALHLDSKLKVMLITKTEIEKSNSWLAQGGIAAVISPTDNVESHVADTLEAGAGLCDEKAVRVLVKEGPENIRELIRMDVPFDTNPEGELQIGREGGHSCRRIVHCGGDATGRETTKRLGELALARDNIKVSFRSYLIDILTEDNCVVGALIFDGQLRVIRTANIILATGGIGHLYRYTTNPVGAVGDGIAAAKRAGASLELMEMVQFHPTTLLSPRDKTRLFLISEAVRGEGAVLRNLEGVAFMQGVHRLADLAPRDIVTRAILKELERTGAPYALLDVSSMTDEFFRHRFPTIYARCKEEGIDIPKQPIPIHPAQHYFMGGIRTDINGMTSVEGLYAAGECACTGIHGANRLASNSMLECLVFGRRAAIHINEALRQMPGELNISTDDPPSAVTMPRAECAVRHEYLRKVMSKYMGAIKTHSGMEKADQEVSRMMDEISRCALHSQEEYELYSMLEVATEMIAAARARKTSVGAHYLADEEPS